MSRNYECLPTQPGIRKHRVTGRYQALKKLRGKQFAKTFTSIREAQRWRSTFNTSSQYISITKTTSTLGEVWARMKVLHFPSLELSTRRAWEQRWKLLSALSDFQMEDITSAVINTWIESSKQFFICESYLAKGRGQAGRCSLYNELNLFTTIFNWYKSEDEFETESAGLMSPIRRRHRTMAFIREPAIKMEQRKITVAAAYKFFKALPELYADLAMTQFFCAGRIGETAGIQIRNIYLEEEYFVIRDAISWCNESKTFEYLKPFPKNKEARRVYVHPQLREILDRRLKGRVKGCSYLFHIEGKPLNYCTIQSNYRRAQRKAGIPYRGTHCLRHGMATLARRVGGMGLDSVIAMTGHRDLKLADHYSKIDGELQKETSLKIIEHIRAQGLI